MPVLRVDCRDSVVVPDVGVNLAVHEFEFVKLSDGRFSVHDCDGFCHPKAVRIEKSKAIRAVAQNKRAAVGSEAPAFAVVLKLPDLFKAPRVVDETELMLPGELVNLVVQQGDAFGEIRQRDVDFLQYLSALQLDVSQTRATFLPRALEHFAVEIDETLRKRAWIVRPNVDDLVAKCGNRGVCRRIVGRAVRVRAAAVALHAQQRQEDYDNQEYSGHDGIFRYLPSFVKSVFAELISECLVRGLATIRRARPARFRRGS